MNDFADWLATLQFCRNALSPPSHPAHPQRLDALAALIRSDSSASERVEARAISPDSYLFTLKVCRDLTRENATHFENVHPLEQFVRQTLLTG